MSYALYAGLIISQRMAKVDNMTAEISSFASHFSLISSCALTVCNWSTVSRYICIADSHISWAQSERAPLSLAFAFPVFTFKSEAGHATRNSARYACRPGPHPGNPEQAKLRGTLAAG